MNGLYRRNTLLKLSILAIVIFWISLGYELIQRNGENHVGFEPQSWFLPFFIFLFLFKIFRLIRKKQLNAYEILFLFACGLSIKGMPKSPLSAWLER